MSNFAARAATAGELTKFRAAGQRTILGLAIHVPETVYSMQINQTFSTLDGVAELTYDNGSGTLTDVKPGMTVLVGSTAGARDKGLLRVRKDPTADTLYIGQTSDVVFEDDQYLTIVDDFQLWPRDIAVAGNQVLMDYDIPFGSYLNGGAINRVGPIAAVLKLSGGSVTFNPPDPTDSECYDGATISSYLYEAPGASSTSDMDTSAPEWTYDTAGQYRWSCTITDSLGRETTSYRWIFVDPDPFDFELNNCFGDFQSGYWQFSVTCFSDATTDDIYERALVTLYAQEEYYGGVAGSIGKIAGYENILCVGWIDGESIVRDPDVGTVTFTVRGPGYWLDEMRAFPFEIQHTGDSPTSWKQIEDLTVDKALAHVLYWMSTAPVVMDCYFTGDTTQKQIITEPSGSLMDQLNNIALNNIFAKPLVNNYGQLYVEIDPQLADSSARSGFPVVMDITSEDYLGSLDIQRRPSSRAAMIELSGYESYDGVSNVQVFARAPGNFPKRHGDFRAYNNYIFADQDECNRQAGALLAFENNEYDPLDMDLSANNRLFDIAPRMVATLSLAAGDTPRGVVLTDQRLYPRRVELAWDKNNNVLTTNITFEFETAGVAVDGITYVPPTINDTLPNLNIGGIGNVDFPDLDLGDWFPDEVPTDVVQTDCAQNKLNQFTLNWDNNLLIGEDSGDLIARCYFPCYVRSAYAVTTLWLNGSWYGDAPTHYGVYGIKGGQRILTASVSQADHNNAATFSPLSDTLVDGFEIALEAGFGSILADALPGEVITTGTVLATNESGVAVPTTPGNYYAIEGNGGPWNNGPDGSIFYMFKLNGDGIIGYNGLVPTLYLILPSIGIRAEAVSTYHGRVYFQASASSVMFAARDNPGAYGDNSGSLGYILRSATLIGRRIALGPFTLKNVCTQI